MPSHVSKILSGHIFEMNEQKFEALLERTAQFHGAVATHISGIALAPGGRYEVAFNACMLSIEHAAGALILISHGIIAPGFSLYRPQFESLVRGIWLLHAASDNWVAKLSAPLTLENANKGNEALMLADMLKQLENSSAPKHLVDQLTQYRDVTWKALNSYAHGGRHPISRSVAGYPRQLVRDALLNSNALVSLAAQLAAILSNDPQNMYPVRELHTEFVDCIPIV